MTKTTPHSGVGPPRHRRISTEAPTARHYERPRNAGADLRRQDNRPHAAVRILVETCYAGAAADIEAILPAGSRLHVLRANDAPCVHPDSPPAQAFALPELTGRQRDILPLIVQRLSNKQIGRTLGLSPFTVRNHVSLLLRLLEVPTRKAAIAKLASLPLPVVHSAIPRIA